MIESRGRFILQGRGGMAQGRLLWFDEKAATRGMTAFPPAGGAFLGIGVDLSDLEFSCDEVESFDHSCEFGLAIFECIEEESSFVFRVGDDSFDIFHFEVADVRGLLFLCFALVEFSSESSCFGECGDGLLFENLYFFFEHGACLFVCSEFVLEFSHGHGGVVEVQGGC